MQRRKRKIQSLIKDLLFNFAAIIFGFTCLFLLLTNFAHTLPTVFDRLLIRISSQSMSPEYNRGDVVIIRKTPPDELSIGDIVAFYRYEEKEYSSIIWFHRIIDIAKTKDGELIFQTKGDANRFPDAKPVNQKSVIGVKCLSSGPLNQLLSFFISPYGIVISVIAPSCYIFVYETLILVKIINDDNL